MKIEFDVPDFERELEVCIVIRKDGEVVFKQETTPSSESSNDVGVEKPKPVQRKRSVSPPQVPGNFMGSDF